MKHLKTTHEYADHHGTLTIKHHPNDTTSVRWQPAHSTNYYNSGTIYENGQPNQQAFQSLIDRTAHQSLPPEAIQLILNVINYTNLAGPPPQGIKTQEPKTPPHKTCTNCTTNPCSCSQRARQELIEQIKNSPRIPHPEPISFEDFTHSHSAFEFHTDPEQKDSTQTWRPVPTISLEEFILNNNLVLTQIDPEQERLAHQKRLTLESIRLQQEAISTQGRNPCKEISLPTSR